MCIRDRCSIQLLVGLGKGPYVKAAAGHRFVAGNVFPGLDFFGSGHALLYPLGNCGLFLLQRCDFPRKRRVFV